MYIFNTLQLIGHLDMIISLIVMCILIFSDIIVDTTDAQNKQL